MIDAPDTLRCMWPLGCDRMAQCYDHDKLTNIVRAALCDRHNQTLGMCGDQPASLRQVADWLESASLGFLYIDVQRARKRDHYHRNIDRIRATNRDWWRINASAVNARRRTAYKERHEL